MGVDLVQHLVLEMVFHLVHQLGTSMVCQKVLPLGTEMELEKEALLVVQLVSLILSEFQLGCLLEMQLALQLEMQLDTYHMLLDTHLRLHFRHMFHHTI